MIHRFCAIIKEVGIGHCHHAGAFSRIVRVSSLPGRRCVVAIQTPVKGVLVQVVVGSQKEHALIHGQQADERLGWSLDFQLHIGSRLHLFRSLDLDRILQLHLHVEGLLGIAELAGFVNIVEIDATIRRGQESWLYSDVVDLLGFRKINTFGLQDISTSDNVIHKVLQWPTGVQRHLVFLTDLEAAKKVRRFVLKCMGFIISYPYFQVSLGF